MNFGLSNRTIVKADGCRPLQLPPVTTPETLLKLREIADGVTNSDRLDVTDLADDLKRLRYHDRASTQPYVYSPPLTFSTVPVM